MAIRLSCSRIRNVRVRAADCLMLRACKHAREDVKQPRVHSNAGCCDATAAPDIEAAGWLE